MPQVRLNYVIHNGSTGADVSFYEDQEAASLAAKAGEKTGTAELAFDDNGKLLNPAATKELLKQALADVGKQVTATLADNFAASATQPPKTALPQDLNGKTVTFTGTFLTMRRSLMKSTATSVGARIADLITAKVDFIVAGEDAGDKLREATELGIPVLSEKQWLDAVQRVTAQKSATPKPGA